VHFGPSEQVIQLPIVQKTQLVFTKYIFLSYMPKNLKNNQDYKLCI